MCCRTYFLAMLYVLSTFACFFLSTGNKFFERGAVLLHSRGAGVMGSIASLDNMQGLVQYLLSIVLTRGFSNLQILAMPRLSRFQGNARIFMYSGGCRSVLMTGVSGRGKDGKDGKGKVVTHGQSWSEQEHAMFLDGLKVLLPRVAAYSALLLEM
jgi:hypothetical protein